MKFHLKICPDRKDVIPNQPTDTKKGTEKSQPEVIKVDRNPIIPINSKPNNDDGSNNSGISSAEYYPTLDSLIPSNNVHYLQADMKFDYFGTLLAADSE